VERRRWWFLGEQGFDVACGAPQAVEEAERGVGAEVVRAGFGDAEPLIRDVGDPAAIFQEGDFAADGFAGDAGGAAEGIGVASFHAGPCGRLGLQGAHRFIGGLVRAEKLRGMVMGDFPEHDGQGQIPIEGLIEVVQVLQEKVRHMQMDLGAARFVTLSGKRRVGCSGGGHGSLAVGRSGEGWSGRPWCNAAITQSGQSAAGAGAREFSGPAVNLGVEEMTDSAQ
jgi:hypothetical protein